jgi:hypothetical protein
MGCSMKRMNTNSFIKCAGLLAALLVASSLLSGCAGMMNRLGYTPIQASVTQACEASHVLLTNLNENAHRRSYMLPNGRACPEVNYYEQAKQEKLQAQRNAQ